MTIKQLSLILLSLTYSTFTVTSQPSNAAPNQNTNAPITLIPTPTFRNARELLDLEREKAYLQYCYNTVQKQGFHYNLNSSIHGTTLGGTCRCMDALNKTDREALTDCYVQARETALVAAQQIRDAHRAEIAEKYGESFVQNWDNASKEEINRGLEKAKESIQEIDRRLDMQEFIVKKFS